jgi:hypothetical protein
LAGAQMTGHGSLPADPDNILLSRVDSRSIVEFADFDVAFDERFHR